MNIAVLCRRLSDNTFVRSYLLLQTLDEENVNVDVYGLVDSRGIHEYFDQDQFNFHIISTDDYADWDSDPTISERVQSLSVQARDAIRLWRWFNQEGAEDADVIFVASGWKGSVGAGLLSKLVSPRSAPVVVDVYDRTEWVEQFPFINPLNGFDKILASNQPLAKKLGGTVLYTPVNTHEFDPSKYDRDEIRAELGVEDEYLAGFIGTPRWNKGTDILVDATSEMDNVRSVVVGMTEGEFGDDLKQQASEDAIFIPPVPHKDVPKFYAAIDALVLPHRDHANSEFQIPAKLFEAMSMGTPVIATDVGDISHVLGGTGVALDKASPEHLREAIQTVRDNGGSEMGMDSRKRAIEEFSAESIGSELINILKNLSGNIS